MSANVASDEIDVNLTPLLDLVLQLIMFFIITVNFVRVDQFDESVSLPVAQSAVPLKQPLKSGCSSILTVTASWWETWGIYLWTRRKRSKPTWCAKRKVWNARLALPVNAAR